MSKSAGGHAEPFFLFTDAKVQQKKLEMCNTVQFCAIPNYFPNSTLNRFMPRLPSRDKIHKAST